jgi:prepilin-type N-terminal cleavage/methylation domain-containing protein
MVLLRQLVGRKVSVCRSPQGFNLLEMVTVVAIAGIAVAIATPSYVGWSQQQRLKAVQDQVYGAMWQARDQAVRENRPHQISFREIGDRLEWSVHPTNVLPTSWTPLPPEIKLDSETTLRRKAGVYLVQFNDYGEVNGQLGRITLSLAQNPQQKTCLLASTLLGKIRRGSMHAKPQNGRYCY